MDIVSNVGLCPSVLLLLPYVCGQSLNGSQADQCRSDSSYQLSVPSSPVPVFVTQVSDGTQDGDIDNTEQSTGNTRPQNDFSCVYVKLAALSLGLFNFLLALGSVGKLFGNDTLNSKQGENRGNGSSDNVSVPRDVSAGVGVVTNHGEETDVGDAHDTAQSTRSENDVLGLVKVLTNHGLGVLKLSL